jgi:hypothetical protein
MIPSIEQAYQAYREVRSKDPEADDLDELTNRLKALAQAPLQLRDTDITFEQYQDRVAQLVGKKRINSYIEQCKQFEDLAAWLAVLVTFLKAGPNKKREGKEVSMRAFQLAEEIEPMEPEQLSKRAQELSAKLENNASRNKIKSMGAHLNLARNHWEALAILARYYPRQRVPKNYVDALVEHLGKTDLRSFKRLVAQSLIFFEANQINAEQ